MPIYYIQYISWVSNRPLGWKSLRWQSHKGEYNLRKSQSRNVWMSTRVLLWLIQRLTRGDGYLYSALRPFRWPEETLWHPSVIAKSRTRLVLVHKDEQVFSLEPVSNESHRPYLPHRSSESSSWSPRGAVQIRQRDQCSCFSARLWTGCNFLNSLQMMFFSLWPHLLPLQALLLFFLEVLLPLYALTLGLLAGFCFSFLPLK